MHTNMHPYRIAALSVLLLAGCSEIPLLRLPSPIPPASSPSTSSTPAASREAPVPSQASRIDGYKTDFAQAVLAANPDRTFSGQLPPMLPAIVVVNISIDAEGNLAKAVVQRSRDSEASQVALNSIKRAAPFPRPSRLLRSGSRLLEFSETFLFNHDYRFQLRTLAGPQLSE
jgi:periplasmic protein TonB